MLRPLASLVTFGWMLLPSAAAAQQVLSPLGEIQAKMDDSHRRLAQGDTGSQTRGRQQQIVTLLKELIAAAEAAESRSQSGAGQPQPGQAQAGQSSQQREPGQSGQTGGGSRGTDRDATEPPVRGAPQSPWSKLRDRERDPVFSAIQQRFPARYQQLLEQYYKSFQAPQEEKK
jgi:hypothetical protein